MAQHEEETQDIDFFRFFFVYWLFFILNLLKNCSNVL